MDYEVGSGMDGVGWEKFDNPPWSLSTVSWSVATHFLPLPLYKILTLVERYSKWETSVCDKSSYHACPKTM